MAFILRYGTESAVTLDSRGETTVCDAPRGTPLDDLAAALAAALAQPLDYPPLAQAVLPGDKVTLALGTDLPQAAVVVEGVLSTLASAGIAADDVTVLRTNEADGNSFRTHRALIHDATDRRQLAFLGSTAGGDEIYLNRALADADVAITLGCLRLQPAAGYQGIAGGIYPAFSDARTQARFRGLEQPDASADARRKGAADVKEAARQLGVQFTIQVAPGRGDDVLRVLAGLADSVERRGQELMKAAWRFIAPRKAELVLAAIEGPPERQTWAAMGRAVAAALPLVADEGAIAVCCDLDVPPGPAIESLGQADDRRGALRRWRKHPPDDLLPAVQLAEALARARVYLLSRLDEAVVEDLGLGSVANGGELARLVSRHGSCMAIANAQHARVAVEGEEA